MEKIFNKRLLKVVVIISLLLGTYFLTTTLYNNRVKKVLRSETPVLNEKILKAFGGDTERVLDEKLNCYEASRKFSKGPTYCQTVYEVRNSLLDNPDQDLIIYQNFYDYLAKNNWDPKISSNTPWKSVPSGADIVLGDTGYSSIEGKQDLGAGVSCKISVSFGLPYGSSTRKNGLYEYQMTCFAEMVGL